MLEKAGSSQNRTNPLITPKFTEYLQTCEVVFYNPFTHPFIFQLGTNQVPHKCLLHRFDFSVHILHQTK